MILVTGATGILGRVIVLELLKQGHKVRATKRKSSDIEEVKQSLKFYTDNFEAFFAEIDWVDVDFKDIFSLQQALAGVTEVYHCAATVSFHPGFQREMFRTNIDGTRQLLYACEDSSVQKFCYVSSTSVLDGLNENGALDEDSFYNAKINHSNYAISKHIAEMEVWRASAEGLQTVIINPGVIIGSGNWDKSSGLIFKNLTRPYTFSGGTAYIDVRDVAKIAVELMEKEVFDERFILISENKTFFEMSVYLRKKIGEKAPKIIPNSLLRIASVLSFLLGWLFSLLKLANKVNTETVTTFTPISNDKIKELIGYQFIPVEESLDFHFKNYLSDTQNK
ncbi:NAD-dependent epimerase [Chryseobacterium sp. 6424]|uniref:SDR family NAD(P)-dependent oxidoreductase n=1 Tax=Chryseobacterium sp. 6424 TaxID=2039166 RepID=UPI000EFD7851|nr:SDR family NAD(P)-dependent oxidoreductase [Chryseobacterium sp. 6424]AYO57101.1 NAD-dependent epimerase [Chryseobacterium sp. 6424]